MFRPRPTPLRRATLTLLLLLPAQAKAPADLSQAEIITLTALSQRLRPAVLRVEDCPAQSCRAADAIGTAFFIEDGLALTAYHVIFGASDLSVRTSNGKVYPAAVVGYDEVQDLALLRVTGVKNAPSLPLTRQAPKVGEAVLALGNGGTAFLRPQLGRVTGLNVDSGEGELTAGTLETNLTLMPGDSGGPLLSRAGEVLGAADHVVWTGGDQGEYRAYAVPLTANDPRIADLRRGIKRDAAVAGVGLLGELGLLQNLPASNFAKASDELGLKLGDVPGAFFNTVSPGGPAALAGLQPLRYDAAGKRLQGDLITAVAGKEVGNFSEFQRAVRSYQPGTPVTLTVIRDGKTIQVTLKLSARQHQ